MTHASPPRVLSIPPGAPFLPTLAKALMEGRLVPGFQPGDDALALADVTIFVPTRRAARSLRGIFAASSPAKTAILPTIRPLGEFDEDEAAFEPDGAGVLDLAPPVPAMDRLLHLARLVRAWKRRLPAHVAQRFAEEVVVPASSADALWLARDLAALMDEIETEGSDWTRLADLAPEALAGWWQVTLDFLSIVTEQWPQYLVDSGLSNPAAHRSALIRLEAERLKRRPPAGPVIAAGSTGSIPATADLLSVIARLPNGAVVLPGLDQSLDARSWSLLTGTSPRPATLGHPQYGLAKLLGRLGISRADVEDIGAPTGPLAMRARLLTEALRPAETTDDWATGDAARPLDRNAALAGVTLVEAARERDEAAAIAVALRLAVDKGSAALVTADRELARRVSTELSRFGIRADDSGGTPLAKTPPATLLSLLVEAAFRPGDPVPLVALLKHPLLRLGMDRAVVREAAETIELVALRGAAGRADVALLNALFDQRRADISTAARKPFWWPRLHGSRLGAASDVLARIVSAAAPLATLRDRRDLPLAELARLSVVALETLGRDTDGTLTELYKDAAGERLAEFLRGLVTATAPFELAASEWPDVLTALMATETVKPPPNAERRVAIWGALEARLQSVDTLVIGGLNEGVWPRRAEADRFMSRVMKSGLDLEPPERRIGQAAHDFVMAMGAREVVLTRSARSGEAPAVASRWLQRLLAFAGPAAVEQMRGRGRRLLDWAGALDAAPASEPFKRPEPTPPLRSRPEHFSVTEIETLRRDPYAIYARRILRLQPLDPLLRDPGAAERGSLFHAILHRFTARGGDPADAGALERLIACGRECFAELALPPDIEAVWWPRFRKLADGIVAWERGRLVMSRHAEVRAGRTPVGKSGVTLSGFADRIDLLPAGHADIIDYKTGSYPSKGQAHTLLSPQLALEAALLRRGAFAEVGVQEPAELLFVRLKANGQVDEESILKHSASLKSAPGLAEESWTRLGELLAHYADPAVGYKSRALPFRENEPEGDYDHLARVLEWSAGGDGSDAGEGDA